MPKKAADTETISNHAVPSKKLRKLVKEVRVAMLTTVSQDGRLRSRPMLSSETGWDAGLWFVTRNGSQMAEEVRGNPHVNISYADRKGGRYLSISGIGRLVGDTDRVKELWSGKHKAWFPMGKKDPELVLLHVEVDQAEQWDAEAGSMVPLAESSERRETDHPSVVLKETGAGAQG